MFNVKITYEQRSKEEIPHYLEIVVSGHAVGMGESVLDDENHAVSDRLCASFSLALDAVSNFLKYYPQCSCKLEKGYFRFSLNKKSVVSANKDSWEFKELDARLDTLVWIIALAHEKWPSHFASYDFRERKEK